MTTFDELLDEAVEQRTTNPNTETVEVLVGKTLTKLKFSEMDPEKWVNIIAVHPPREGAIVDGYVNYDYNAIVRDAAPVSCVRVDGEADVPVSVEQWEKIFKVLTPQSFVTMADAAWKLNVLMPTERLEQAKKDLRAAAASKKK